MCINTKFLSHPEKFLFSKILHLKTLYCIENHVEQDKGPYLKKWAKIWIKGYFIFSNFKSLRKESIFTSSFFGLFAKYGHFLGFSDFLKKVFLVVKKIKARSFKGAFKNDYFSVIDRPFPHMGKIVKLILVQNWSRFNFFYEQIVFSEKFTISQKSVKNPRKIFLQIVLT